MDADAAPVAQPRIMAIKGSAQERKQIEKEKYDREAKKRGFIFCHGFCRGTQIFAGWFGISNPALSRQSVRGHIHDSAKI